MCDLREGAVRCGIVFAGISSFGTGAAGWHEIDGEPSLATCSDGASNNFRSNSPGLDKFVMSGDCSIVSDSMRPLPCNTVAFMPALLPAAGESACPIFPACADAFCACASATSTAAAASGTLGKSAPTGSTEGVVSCISDSTGNSARIISDSSATAAAVTIIPAAVRSSVVVAPFVALDAPPSTVEAVSDADSATLDMGRPVACGSFDVACGSFDVDCESSVTPPSSTSVSSHASVAGSSILNAPSSESVRESAIASIGTGTGAGTKTRVFSGACAPVGCRGSLPSSCRSFCAWRLSMPSSCIKES